MVVKQSDCGPDRVALTHRFMMVTRLARMPPYAVLSVHQRSVDSTPQLRGMKLMPEAMLIVRGTAHGHGLGHQFPMSLAYRKRGDEALAALTVSPCRRQPSTTASTRRSGSAASH